MTHASHCPLNYSAPEERKLPVWARFFALVFWVSVVFFVYGGAIAGPAFLVFSIVAISHSSGGLHAFGEPVVTTWQKTKMVLLAAAMTAVFVPLAFWIRKQ